MIDQLIIRLSFLLKARASFCFFSYRVKSFDELWLLLLLSARFKLKSGHTSITFALKASRRQLFNFCLFFSLRFTKSQMILRSYSW